VIDPKEHLIVYVDDERPNRVVFEQSFASRFRLRAVASGREAIEILRAEPVAVLVTDQRMPEMSGEELLRLAKAQWPNTVRVIITAHSDLDPILSAVNEGLVARYIIKPWDRAELEQILRWSVEAFALASQDSALQLRLIHTERLVTLGSIAAAVAHDLNQPLATLLANAERIQSFTRLIKKLPDLTKLGLLTAEDRTELANLVEELPDIAEDAVTAARNMTRMVEGIRHFSNTRRAGEQAATDPMNAVRYAMNICLHETRRAGARLIYEGPENLPRVTINETELCQILVNLIANAAQALVPLKQRGGRVVLRAEPRSSPANAQVRTVWFAVIDDGPGMAPDVLERVGKPYFSTRESGTGLGVAQCKRLVARAGGDLSIESSVGKGTTVSFHLQVAP
jgi:signal transduction histidine kinase